MTDSARPPAAGELPAGTVAASLDPSGQLRGAISDCVHCGFCLPACPTYELWGEEMDSPRGRIHLIAQLLDGAEATPAAATHLDRCLGCMACVPACPSGVRYDVLIEAARSWGEPAAPSRPESGGPARSGSEAPGILPARGRRERIVRAAIFATFPYPRRLAALSVPLRAAQLAGLDRLITGGPVSRLVPELAGALRVAPRLRRRAAGTGPVAGGRRHRPASGGRLPRLIPARGQRRAVVGLLTGCVQRAYFPGVNAATAAVLAAEGCDVVIPPGQGCCGALSVHGGRVAEAAAFARAVIDCFERAGVDAVVVNAAGCGSAIKGYGELLAGDPVWSRRAAALAAKAADFTEFLAGQGTVAVRHPLPLAAAYQDPCHLAHAQGIAAQPRELLRQIPGLRLAEPADPGLCCGSAGTYSLLQSEASRQLGERKAQTLLDTGAQLVISANPGCQLQVAAALTARGSPLPVRHVAEVLDASIRGVPASALLAR